MLTRVQEFVNAEGAFDDFVLCWESRIVIANNLRSERIFYVEYRHTGIIKSVSNDTLLPPAALGYVVTRAFVPEAAAALTVVFERSFCRWRRARELADYLRLRDILRIDHPYVFVRFVTLIIHRVTVRDNVTSALPLAAVDIVEL